MELFWATISWAGRDWGWLAAGLLLTAALLLAWSYRRAALPGTLRAACLGLKLLGVAALLACLMEPLWSGQHAKPGANLFIVMADNSQGLQIKDRGQTQSRGQVLRSLLTGPGGEWQASLAQNFQVRRYLFDSRVQHSADFREFDFAGHASSMVTALRTVSERLRGRPVAGILLFTDGNATDLGAESPDLSGLPPVYPVVVGTDDPISDVALQKVIVTQSAFEDAPVTIQADLDVTGYAGQDLTLRLLAADPSVDPAQTPATQPAPAEKILLEQTQRALRAVETLTFRLQIRPERSGVLFYRLQAAPESELPALVGTGASTEATLANNSRVIVVDRGQGPYRVLAVAGRPNWEYKFLSRALEDDRELNLVGLIRIARREPKFTFKGRAGEYSNPLFRGFDRQSDDTERYDQPVLIRLNARDALELQGGFPKTAEDLYGYHAVIVDDLEADFFNGEQQTLLQKFVSERGGGFLMLGGQESFQQGRYERTPIGEMLPVYLAADTQPKTPAALRLALTREGWLQPWLRLRSIEDEEKTRLENLPLFGVLNHVASIKPGATVLAQVEDPKGQRFPALVTQRFGHGRSAALLLGDWWHGGLRSPELQADLAKAWRQMIRWLVADVPRQIELQAEPRSAEPVHSVLLRVRARDNSFQPLENASVTVTVRPLHTVSDSLTSAAKEDPARPAQTQPVRLQAEPVLSESGVYETTYVPRLPSGYLAEAVVTNLAGAEVGRAQTGWATDMAADEFRSLQPNRSLLQTVARQTRGELVDASRLESFAKELPRRQAPVTETWTHPLWHQPAVFLFALACFIAEWALRRFKALA